VIGFLVEYHKASMSTPKDLIGTRLGRYDIVEHLATGGMAEIYLARHPGVGQFQKDLVLKVLQSRWEDHPEVVKLFLGEARISAMMNHPSIVDVYDVAEDRGRHFIAMEHIAGRTLTEIAKRAIQVAKSIPVEVGAFIAAEIAGALAHMYDGLGVRGDPHHVVHRDISPTNILVSTSGQVKLIDFGIARQGLSIVEESGARMGKVTYMSPEQVRGDAVDGRSDIFCLGTILYEITLGRRLWRGSREVASKRILEERPQPPTFVRRDYPADLELIVLRTLEKKPDDRYQTATELHQDLHGFLSRSSAYLRNNFQMADYVGKIFSEEAEALISEDGRKRAEAFVAGSENGVGEDLDFDVRQSVGPGAALARALRASALGVWADVGGNREQGAVEAEMEAKEKPRLESTDTRKQQEAEVPTAAASSQTMPVAGASGGKRPSMQAMMAALDSGPPASPENLLATKTTAKNGGSPSGQLGHAKDPAARDTVDRLPRRWQGIVVAGIVAVVVAMGVLWWLSGG
jgi:predicted Ser/Thr protein kinase